jgi:hypothetical protein
MSSTMLLVGLVLVVALLVALGSRHAGVGSVAIAFVVLAYLVVPGVLARLGALDRYDPLPAPALLLLLGLSVLTAVLVFSSPGTRLALRVPLASVVTLQAFRIAVEWLLHRFYVEGLVPVQMTYAGRNFDIVSGATGLVLGLWLLTGRSAPHGVLLAWNLLSLGLLINIVTVAVLSTPVPFRQFLEGPPNLLPSTFPYVWLPSFLVQLALGSHLLVFRKLAQHRR